VSRYQLRSYPRERVDPGPESAGSGFQLSRGSEREAHAGVKLRKKSDALDLRGIRRIAFSLDAPTLIGCHD